MFLRKPIDAFCVDLRNLRINHRRPAAGDTTRSDLAACACTV